MQTFLPFENFYDTARVLDNKRLGKQRVECVQILNALEGRSVGWVNHPVTHMWKGYERYLCDYAIAICLEWRNRGYKDTLLPQFIMGRDSLPVTPTPTWLGYMPFHLSHQSNLKRKDSEYYLFNVPNNLKYLWFNNYTQTWFTTENKNENKKVKIGEK